MGRKTRQLPSWQSPCCEVTRLAHLRLNTHTTVFPPQGLALTQPQRSFIEEYTNVEIRMPAPTKLPAHRIACLALYRAFRSHIPRLPLEPAQAQFIEWHTRNEFKRNRNAQGIKRIRNALSYARNSESLMRAAATGDPESITKLSEEITKLQKKRDEDLFVATLSPPPPKPPPPPTIMPTRKWKLRRLDPNYKPPPRSPIPRPPRLIESNMFPILRWPGQKTPLRISMIIKKKTVKKQKRFDLLELLEVWIVLAQEEDIFDNIIARETGVREEGGTWEQGVRSTWKDVKDLMRKEELRGVGMTKRFMEIIEQQKMIRENMILERDRERRRKYRLRRAEREKREREEADLLAEKEPALEGPEKISAGEWDEGSDVPFVRYPSCEESAFVCDRGEQGDLERGHKEDQSEYEEPEHGDPEHEYEEYGHDDLDQEYDDLDQEYEEPEYSSNSDLDNTNPDQHPTPNLTPDSSIPPAPEPTSTSEDKP